LRLRHLRLKNARESVRSRTHRAKHSFYQSPSFAFERAYSPFACVLSRAKPNAARRPRAFKIQIPTVGPRTSLRTLVRESRTPPSARPVRADALTLVSPNAFASHRSAETPECVGESFAIVRHANARDMRRRSFASNARDSFALFRGRHACVSPLVVTRV